MLSFQISDRNIEYVDFFTNDSLTCEIKPVSNRFSCEMYCSIVKFQLIGRDVIFQLQLHVDV